MSACSHVTSSEILFSFLLLYIFVWTLFVAGRNVYLEPDFICVLLTFHFLQMMIEQGIAWDEVHDHE